MIEPVVELVDWVVSVISITPDVFVVPESVSPEMVGLVASTTLPVPVTVAGLMFVAEVNCAMFPLTGEPLEVTVPALAVTGSP